MAVYTDVTDAELRRFLGPYDLGALLSFKGIAEGVENSNFILRTERGSFILTLYEKRVAEEDLPFFLGLMEHLARRGLSCPLPVRGRDGMVLRHVAGRPAAMISFLDGVWIRQPEVGHCAQVGRALAELHKAGEGFELRRPNALSLASWPGLAAMSGVRADEVRPGLAATIAGEIAFLQGCWPADLPSGVIHADLFPDNVFFLEDRLSGLIDFYFACNDLYAYDLAICLNAWCFGADGALDVEKGRALVEQYQAVRPLTGAERAAFPILARGCALRFLLTRLYDWLVVPEGALVTPKDPLEYLAKLRFHQSVGESARYGIGL